MTTLGAGYGQIETSHAALLWLIEFGFVGGTMRRTNWTHSVDWAGHTWSGLGAVLSVSPINDSEQLQYPALELGLNIANPALLAVALGSPAQYKRRPITLNLAVLDDELRPIGNPEVFWAGLMDQIKVRTGDGEGQEGQVLLRCELTGRGSLGAQGLRLNNAQQQRRAPGDTGLSRIEQLTAQPRPWLTKKFQRI